MSVSVAVAAYNGSRYIREQISSILPQLSPEDEVVVSLDPSTDDTADILCAMSRSDSRLRLIDGPGKGVRANFENALRHCHGDILFLCDQDDVWCDNKVAQVQETFAKKPVVLVLHDARIVDETLRVTAPSFFAFHGSRPGYWRNFCRNSYIGCCMAFRRELLPWILPFPADLPMHDQWIGLLAEKHGGTAFIKEPLLLYRRHGDNVSQMTHSSVGQMLRWRWSLLRQLNKRKGRES